MKFSMAKRGLGWSIIDPNNATISIPFDQAIVDATVVEEGYVEGYIQSAHGIDIDLVGHLDLETQRALGIGAQLLPQKPIGRILAGGMRRVRLTEDGSIERIGVR